MPGTSGASDGRQGGLKSAAARAQSALSKAASVRVIGPAVATPQRGHGGAASVEAAEMSFVAQTIAQSVVQSMGVSPNSGKVATSAAIAAASAAAAYWNSHSTIQPPDSAAHARQGDGAPHRDTT